MRWLVVSEVSRGGRPVEVVATLVAAAQLVAACGGSGEVTDPVSTGASPAAVTDSVSVADGWDGIEVWSREPCREPEQSPFWEWEASRSWVELEMMAYTDVVVRVSSIEVLGAERRKSELVDGDIDEGAPWLEEWCSTWLEMQVSEVLFQDHASVTSDGVGMPLPDPPFTITVMDSHQRLVSLERGFSEIAERPETWVFGLLRGSSSDLVGQPGKSYGFTLALIASDIADRVFFPDPVTAEAASSRLVVVRDRLGASSIIEVVATYRRERGDRWLSTFADVYPPREPEWDDDDDGLESMPFGLPAELLAEVEAIGVEYRPNLIGAWTDHDFGGVIAIESSTGSRVGFGLSLAVEGFVLPIARYPGEELSIMLVESPRGLDTPIELGTISGVDPGDIAVIDIDVTTDADVTVTSIGTRRPTELELDAALILYGIQPDGSINPDAMAQPMTADDN